MPTYTMVKWQQADGLEVRTRTYTFDLDEFIADVNEAGGRVLDMHGEGDTESAEQRAANSPNRHNHNF